MQKLAETNLKEMMIDDVDEEFNPSQVDDEEAPKKEILEWYYIDTESTFFAIWTTFINLCLYYTFVMTPMILVFPDLYQTCEPKD